MRKLSLLSLAGLASLGLVATPAQSGTIIQNDLPDFVVMEGETSAVDLSDFFASPSLELTYSVDEGGSVDGSMATVFAADGTFTGSASDGTDSASSSGMVSVSGFLVSGLSVDDNNRVVGMDGGNLFLNGIVPGETVTSNMALGIPEGGGSGTPGGGTGAAALIATIASIEVAADSETGLMVREAGEAVVGTGGVVSDGGLTATLNADGTYSLATTADFSGTSIVTLGADTGDSADAVHLVAAQSTAADLSSAAAFTAVPAGSAAQADVTFGADGITISADAGEGILLLHNAAIAIDGVANISVDYDATGTDGLNIAALGFTGGLGAGNLYYTNTPQVASGVEKNISTVINGDAVNPGVQVLNAGAAAITVTLTGIEVIHAGPVMNYALNPNADAELTVDGSIDDAAAWNADINGQGAGAATLATENNYSTASSAGSLSLAPAGDLNIGQAWTQLSLGQGSFAAEAYVMGGGEGGNFTIHITDGAMAAQGNLAGAAADWTKVSASGSNSNDGAGMFLVLQSSGATYMVDDVSVRVVDENEDDFVDMDLLGL